MQGFEINPKKQSNKFLRKMIPWIVGISVLVYLIWRIEPEPLIDALSHAHLWIYIPSLAVFVYGSFLVDTQNLQTLMGKFGHALSFAESKIIRGASYLIAVVDYTLGMGSVVYFFKEAQQVSLIRGTAIMIYYNYINQLALIALAATGYPLLGLSLPWLTKIMIACLIAVFISVIVIELLKHSNYKLVVKIKQTALMQSFIESSLKTYLINVIYRMGYYFTYVLFFYVAVRAFGMDIPFITLLAYVPIILLVISIPISPFGLGTSQATMLFLFKDYGSQPQILAFSLAYSVSVLLLRAVLGAYYYWIMAGRISLGRGLIKGGYEAGRKVDSETT